MKKFKVGVVGAGHMGTILARIAGEKVGNGKLIVACSNEERSRIKAQKLGCAYGSPKEIIENSEVVFLGMRPQDLESVTVYNFDSIAESDAIFISMLAGVSLERLENCLGKDKRIIRIMPNTPSELGEGIIVYARNGNASESDGQMLRELLGKAGIVEEIGEKDIDIVSVIAGCGPAYAYLFTDALAKGGEECGLDAEKAKKYAAQMLLGSAKMILETGKDPEALKDEVCSPGGTTIEGVKVFESEGLKELTAKAVRASFDKTRKL